jgi:TATA-binding protein-associated factor Taf7
MRNYSTLIYFVNSFQSESDSNHVNLVEASVNNFLEAVPEAEKVPSDLVIQNILNFARSYEVYETKNGGYVELNLN